MTESTVKSYKIWPAERQKKTSKASPCNFRAHPPATFERAIQRARGWHRQRHSRLGRWEGFDAKTPKRQSDFVDSAESVAELFPNIVRNILKFQQPGPKLFF